MTIPTHRLGLLVPPGRPSRYDVGSDEDYADNAGGLAADIGCAINKPWLVTVTTPGLGPSDRRFADRAKAQAMADAMRNAVAGIASSASVGPRSRATAAAILITGPHYVAHPISPEGES